MKADTDLFQAIVRWRENRKAQKSRRQADLSAAPSSLLISQENSRHKLQRDLEKADERSAHHLALPAKKERLVMGKLKLLGLILLFLLAGALFFIAGFLTCYTVLPPAQTSYSAHLPGGGPYGASRPSHGLGVAPADTPLSHRVTPGSSYAARQSLLREARQGQGRGQPSDRFTSALHQAEEQTAYQAKRQAHTLITRTLNRWSMKLRSMFGYYAGSAIAPLTTGLAKQVADSAFPMSPPPRSSSRGGIGTSKSLSLSSGSGDQSAASSHSSAEEQTSRNPIPPSAASPGLYTILVQSYTNSAEAFHLSNTLQSQGFGAYVDQEQSGSGVKFSVKVGQFSNFTDARNAAAIFSQQWHQPARVLVMAKPGQ